MNWTYNIVGIIIFIHLCFILAQFKEDNSIMTFAWPLGLLLIELISFLTLPDEPNPGQVLLLITVILWASRLFIHTFTRNIRRGYEDFRYRELREQTESGFLIRSYIQFFLVQGAFMIIIAIPFIYVNSSSYQTNLIFVTLGFGIFTFGWIIELLADYQLTKFKQTHDKDEILTTGLWALSRHPNYFGEILIWIGFGLMSLNLDAWYVLLSPLIVIILLRYVSGVPLLERRYENSEAYKDYQATTPTLFPFP